jgi:hypothetical protein
MGDYSSFAWDYRLDYAISAYFINLDPSWKWDTDRHIIIEWHAHAIPRVKTHQSILPIRFFP